MALSMPVNGVKEEGDKEPLIELFVKVSTAPDRIKKIPSERCLDEGDPPAFPLGLLLNEGSGSSRPLLTKGLPGDPPALVRRRFLLSLLFPFYSRVPSPEAAFTRAE